MTGCCATRGERRRRGQTRSETDDQTQSGILRGRSDFSRTWRCSTPRTLASARSPRSGRVRQGQCADGCSTRYQLPSTSDCKSKSEVRPDVDVTFRDVDDL